MEKKINKEEKQKGTYYTEAVTLTKNHTLVQVLSDCEILDIDSNGVHIELGVEYFNKEEQVWKLSHKSIHEGEKRGDIVHIPWIQISMNDVTRMVDLGFDEIRGFLRIVGDQPVNVGLKMNVI